MRDGVYRSQSPELIEAALMAAVLAHRPLQEVQQLLSKAHYEKLDVNRITGRLRQLAQSGDDYSRQLKSALDTLSPPSTAPFENIWETGSFSYRGVMQSHKVAGNIRFGGQLYDHYVTRVDQDFFQNISEGKLSQLIDPETARKAGISDKLANAGLSLDSRLNDIEDTHLFSDIVDILIRNSFRTDELELEHLQSDGHKIYDDRVTRLCKLFRINQETSDSLTNISTNMIMGIGDCRHHAQVKQILFDCWQAGKVNQNISRICTQPQQVEKLTNASITLLSQEMVTMDVELHAAVQMKAPYDAVKDENGNYLPDNNNRQNKVEEHTLNVLIERDNCNQIGKITLKDAFYQNEYHFADLPLDDTCTKPRLQTVSVGDHLSVASSQGARRVPVTLKPTIYAGKRDLYEPGTETAYLLNMPLAQMPDETLISPMGRKDLDTFFQNLSEYNP